MCVGRVLRSVCMHGVALAGWSLPSAAPWPAVLVWCWSIGVVMLTGTGKRHAQRMCWPCWYLVRTTLSYGVWPCHAPWNPGFMWGSRCQDLTLVRCCCIAWVAGSVVGLDEGPCRALYVCGSVEDAAISIIWRAVNYLLLIAPSAL